MTPRVSRRGLLGGGLAAAGAAGAFTVGRLPDEAAAQVALDRSYDFRGAPQAGILTPAQDRLHFAAFDVTTDDRDELVSLLPDWPAAAERLQVVALRRQQEEQRRAALAALTHRARSARSDKKPTRAF